MRRKIREQLLSLDPRNRQTAKKLKEKIRESLSSVLPISLLVLLLSVTLVAVDLSTMSLFILGALMLIVGMGLFTLGADMAMLPMGGYVGAHLTKKRSVGVLSAVSLLLGILITMAEPDLSVLANQVEGVPNIVLILTVSVGVGIFLVVALLRVLFQWKLSYILIGLYGLVLLLGVLIRPEFLPMAFDAGGVTTGPLTVPFILALGVGVANVHGGKTAGDDSFGLVALSSVGPILAVMVISLFYPHLSNIPTAGAALPSLETTRDLMKTYISHMPSYFLEVLIALAPIVLLFGVLQAVSLHLPLREIRRLGVGLVYTYLGLVIFLTGVNVGFLPMGDDLGRRIAGGGTPWALIPLGMLMGYLAVAAEPAVHVLNEQVEQVTSGAISKKMMMRTLSIGVSISVGLSMTRVLTGLSIWVFLAPGYLIALGLTFFTGPIFTAIAFDSGGVASGPMTAAFMLPSAMGACAALGGNILENAFGLVAMVAMTPLIAIEALGVLFRIKTGGRQAQPIAPDEDEIIIDV